MQNKEESEGEIECCSDDTEEEKEEDLNNKGKANNWKKRGKDTAVTAVLTM